MKKSLRSSLVLVVCLFSLSAVAGGAVQPFVPMRLMTVYCPPIKKLKKNWQPNQMNWYATGGWKSYTLSFAKKIKEFTGARWIGANIGRAACYYQGGRYGLFPVVLIYHTMTLQPVAGHKHWRKTQDGNYVCFSSRQKQCPLVVQLRPKKRNLYQTIEQLKGQ